MPRFQVSLQRMLIQIAVIVAAIAMVARGVWTWGPLNLLVLAICLLISAAIFACLPIIPHRPFWAGLALFGGLYSGFCFFSEPLFGFNSDHRPLESLFHRWAESQYDPQSNYKPFPGDNHLVRFFDERNFKVDSFVNASHAVMSIGIGLLGGTAFWILARTRDERRWNREKLPEHPLEDFLLPPLKIDPPLQSK